MILRVSMLTAALLILAPAATAHAQDFILDTEMAESDWQVELINDSGGFAVVVGQPATGGNPDTYRSIAQTSVVGPAAGLVVHTHANIWTPSLDGSIDTLDMLLDVNCFNGGTSNAVGFGLVVVQAGVVYYGPSYTALTNSGWRTDLQSTSLTSTDFGTGDPPSNPDFSVNGSTVAFGFFSSNGTGNSSPIGSTSGADNFIVRITSTPPPDAGVAPDAEVELDAGDEPDAGVDLDAEPAPDVEPAPDATPTADAEPASDALPAPDAAPAPDASVVRDVGVRDAGVRLDAGTRVDAGDTDSSEDGCSCGVSGSSASAPLSFGLALLGALAFSRRRRRRCGP